MQNLIVAMACLVQALLIALYWNHLSHRHSDILVVTWLVIQGAVFAGLLGFAVGSFPLGFSLSSVVTLAVMGRCQLRDNRKIKRLT